MREFSLKCGARVPSALRGTELRKHIATRCITLNLSETEVHDLGKFMGHREKIRRDHYRQPLIGREILRMSKLLEIAQGTKEDDEEDSESDNSENEDDAWGMPTAGPSKSQAKKWEGSSKPRHQRFIAA